MKKRFGASTWLSLLLLSVSLSSCVDKEYDFSKIDHKIHQQKSIVRFKDPIPFPTPIFYAYGTTDHKGNGDFTLTLQETPDGFLLGNLELPMSNESKAYASKADMSATIISDIPYELEATISAVEYEPPQEDVVFPFRPLAGVTVTPDHIRIIPGKEIPVSVSFTSGSAFHCETIALKLKTDIQTLDLNENQEISFKDLKISFPEGVDIL